MRKLSLLVTAIFLLVLKANASPVSPLEASALAKAFLKQSEVEQVLTPFEHFYVFNGDQCFVILSADDNALPVLGYSFDCPFKLDMAESTKNWLQSYDDAFQTILESGLQATDEVRSAWISLRESGSLPVCNRSVVKPLVNTTWDQEEPYNIYCPEGCYTGCVAIVMAQIMKYWEYPNMGNGSHSYVHPSYGQQSASFGETTYDWDNMSSFVDGSSPDAAKQAIATLSYHCGVSVDMDYGPDVSLANSNSVMEALPAYFRYSSSLSMQYESDYSDSEWKVLLKNELDASRPMYFSGRHSGGAHAFICDGYDEYDYFHFNWGWEGAYDGYYAIGALNPGAHSYNDNNYVIMGIQPSEFMVGAPTDLNASVQADKQVCLNWLGGNDAAYYKVYRDGELLAPRVDQTCFVDTDTSLGPRSYYVKAVNATGDRSARSNTVEVDVLPTIPAPLDLVGSLHDDELTLAWSMPFGEEDTLAYGMGEKQGFMGYLGTNDTYWGQRYPAEELVDVACMMVTKVSAFFNVEGEYTLYIGKGNSSSITEVMFQKTFSVDTIGWTDMALDEPMPLDYTADFWVALSAPISIDRPASYCEYEGPGLEDASFICTRLDNITTYSYADRHISWMIKVILSDDAFTYSVSHDGIVVATGLSEQTYSDHDITTGHHVYQVWTVCNGMESDEVASYETDLAYIDVASTDLDAGIVEGKGFAEIGSQVSIKAIPQQGCIFRHWLEGDNIVSTNALYSFTVTGDRQLKACFWGLGLDEENETMNIRMIEVFTLNGVKLKTLTGLDELRLDEYAKGIYLLRMTTDKGVITKKL